MKLYKILICIFILSLSLQTYSQNRSINFDHSNWKKLLSKAKTSKKLVFVDCYTTWCGPCKLMARDVFTNDTVADFFNTSFICAKIDMEKGEGLSIAKQYNIQAYPTFIFVDESGTLVYRICGSSSPKYFLDNSKNALIAEKQIANCEKKFNKGNCKAAEAIQYLSMLENACLPTDKAAKLYFVSQKESEFISRANWNIISAYVNEYDAPQIQYVEKNEAQFANLYTVDSVKLKLNNVYNDGLYTTIKKSDSIGFNLLKQKMRTIGYKNTEELILEADIYYYKKKKDWKNYASVTIQYIEKFAYNNTGALNNYAWYFYENIDDQLALEKACDWAKRASEKVDDYANNDTYAAVLFKAGKKEEAKKYALKAIELAKKEGATYSETQKLLDKINKLK